MSSRIFGRAALMALLGGALVSGCMETKVKSTGPRYLTTQEAAEAEYKRKLEEKDKNVPPPHQRTVDEEIIRLRELIEKKDPENPQWHFELGRLYEDQAMYEPAEARYRRGTELLAPGQLDHYTGPTAALGRVLAKEGKTDAALNVLRRAVSVKPQDPEGYYFNSDYRDSYFLIGAIEYSRKNRTEAEKAFRLYLKYGGERHKVVDFFPEMIEDR